MKALNNFVAAAATTAFCEVLVAGQRFRPGPNTMVDILNASTGQSFVTSHVLSEHVVNKRHATGFGLALYAKGVSIAKALTEAMNYNALVRTAFPGAMKAALKELGNVDHTAAMELWEKG